MASENVTININANDNASGKLKKVGQNLKELGEKVSMVGSRMTAAFTVPIVGLAVGLNKMGQDASKAVGDMKDEISKAHDELAKATVQSEKDIANAQDRLSKAMKGKDGKTNLDAIAEAQDNLNKVMLESKAATKEAETGYVKAQKALENMDPSIKKLAQSYADLQKMISPIQAEFRNMAVTLINSILPVLKDFMPTIKDITKEIGSLVKQFADLPLAQRESILKWVGIIAISGPVVFAIGQIAGTVGTLIQLLGYLTKIGPIVSGVLRGIGVSGWAALGPLALMAGALYLLYNVIKDNWPTIQMAAANASYALTGKLPDWAYNIKQPVKGQEGTFSADRIGRTVFGEDYGGMFSPDLEQKLYPMSGGAAATTINVNYAPTVGAATSDDLEKIGYLVEQALRRRR